MTSGAAADKREAVSGATLSDAISVSCAGHSLAAVGMALAFSPEMHRQHRDCAGRPWQQAMPQKACHTTGTLTKGADLIADFVDELLAQLLRSLHALIQCHVRVNALY